MKPTLGASLAQNLGRPNWIAPADIHNLGTGSVDSPIPTSLQAPAVPPQGMALPQYSPGLFGNAQVTTVSFAAAGDLLALVRPASGQRVWLLIVNDLVGNAIRVNFDNAASAANGINIPAGGNLFLDNVVPQNDVHIFAPAAGAVSVAYMVLDVTNPARVIQAGA